MIFDCRICGAWVDDQDDRPHDCEPRKDYERPRTLEERFQDLEARVSKLESAAEQEETLRLERMERE